jgi:hypothetical protein
VFSLLLIGSAVLTAQTKQPHTTYVGKMISSGRNYPTVDINQDGLLELCAELHQRVELPSIRERHGWSEADLASRLDRLKHAGLVKEASPGLFLPTFMVISKGDAAQYLPVSHNLVQQTTTLIAKRLPAIRKEVQSISGLRGRLYSDYSFLLLSDVLLDNWQINNVERSLLGSERPLRDGNHYYFAIMEVPAGQSSEAFGLYGNGGSIQSGNEIDVYGNDRYSGHTLVSASDADLASWFPGSPNPADKNFWPVLISRLAAVGRVGKVSAANPEMRTGMEKLDLVDGDKLDLLVLPRSSIHDLGQIANSFAPDLENLLRHNESTLKAAYEASPYKDETSFNEYFIWWYHLFYTEVTNQLATKKLLRIPSSGNVTYLVSAE